MYHGDGNEHRRSRPSASQSFLPPFELGPPVYFQWVRKLCTTQNQATGLHGSLFSPISDTRGPSAHWLADINIYPQAINHGLLEFPSIQLDDFPGETSTAWPRGFSSLCDDTLWGIPNGTAGGWTKAKGAGRRAKISASDGKIWHEAFVALKPYYPPLIKHGLLDNHPFRSFTSFFLYTVYIVFSFNPPFITTFPSLPCFFLFPQGLTKKRKTEKPLCFGKWGKRCPNWPWRRAHQTRRWGALRWKMLMDPPKDAKNWGQGLWVAFNHGWRLQPPTAPTIQKPWAVDGVGNCQELLEACLLEAEARNHQGFTGWRSRFTLLTQVINPLLPSAIWNSYGTWPV